MLRISFAARFSSRVTSIAVARWMRGSARARLEQLLALIAQAMGKSVDQSVGLDEEEGDEFVEPDELIEVSA